MTPHDAELVKALTKRCDAMERDGWDMSLVRQLMSRLTALEAETIERCARVCEDQPARTVHISASNVETAFTLGTQACAQAIRALPAAQPNVGARDTAGDWPEDFSDENGNYFNSCVHCGNQFRGYKRRVVCKVCANKGTAPNAQREVPRELTDDMLAPGEALIQGVIETCYTKEIDGFATARHIWQAMYDAAWQREEE